MGCGKKGSGANAPDSKIAAGIGQGVGPIVQSQQPAQHWGELVCQKNRSCENRVLNQSQQSWLNVLTANFFEEPDGYKKIVDSDQKQFFCGSEFFAVVVDAFPEFGFADSAFSDLTEFADFILDKSLCVQQENVAERMNSYLNINLQGINK